MEILIFLVLFIVSVVLLLITAIKHFLLRKEHREIIENVKKLDFAKRINKYVKILLIIYLVFFISMYALIVINEYIFRFKVANDSNTISIQALKAAFDVYTDNNYIYYPFFTVVQLFILIYVPTRVIANIILIIKLSSNKNLNESEKGVIKKYYTYKMIINICLGFIIFGVVSMMRFISSWAG